MPQWLVDERLPLTYAPPAAPRHRRGRGIWAALVVVSLAAAWFLTGGTGELAGAWDKAQAAWGDGPLATKLAPPSADVVALADAAHLSDEGRRIFYATRPEILDAAAFAGRCGTVEVSPRMGASGFVGCYQPGADAIVVYRPADPRLAGQAVVTAAHETLHAAWTRLTPAERDELTPILDAAAAAIPADDDIHEQIAGSVGTHPENRPTELFAYLGTQVDGLDPRLEQVYARFVADRAALVAVHTGLSTLLDGMAADITAASQALADTESANAQARAQLAADEASRDVYRTTYQAKVAEVAAMSADQRSRLLLSWVWWDGTDLPMAPADTTLAAAAALLARDDAALPARDTTITAAEASAATERTRVDGLVADFDALQHEMDPTAPAS